MKATLPADSSILTLFLPPTMTMSTWESRMTRLDADMTIFFLRTPRAWTIMFSFQLYRSSCIPSMDSASYYNIYIAFLLSTCISPNSFIPYLDQSQPLTQMMKPKNTAEEENKKAQIENIKEYWTEHRTTLIAFQAQYIYNKKPNQDEDQSEQNKKKGKKKDMEFDGGFLFPGRGEEKEVNVVEKIKESSKPHLKQLFDQNINHSQDMLELREFVKIMLELKHPCIVDEFIEIYENIIKQIKNVKFDEIKSESERFALVNRVTDKVTGYVQSCAYLFKILTTYLKEDRKETMKLFKVTVYCFLAEKHNFNINEFYSDAFEFQETERKAPKKKKKTEKEES